MVLAAEQNLSFLAGTQLCQSGSPGTAAGGSLLMFKEACGQASCCAPRHLSVCSRAELASPRASAAQLLREKAGLAQPPQKSQGWLVERSGR